MKIDLTDLIENPREDLGIECKAWLDLNENIQRAKVARHLAALANYGGGYLLFGFNDDMTRDRNRPKSVRLHYNRDVFSAIVRRYLTPCFQCDVTYASAANGEEFPVVRVPSHTGVPIASRAGGPHDKSGRPQGIVSGTYYIRKPGPESAPIVGAEEWGPLIRRCVLNERDKLLTDFSSLMQYAPSTKVDGAEELTNWHQNCEKRFLELLSNRNHFEWPVPLRENRYQLSYLISTENDEVLPIKSISEILERINVEVRNTVWTGWSMFFPFSRPEIAPRIYPEERDGTGGDVLECDLIIEKDFDITLPDYWRLAPNGRVTLIRAYREDRERSAKALSRSSGTWLSPETVIRETTEVVTHARLLARHFQMPTRIAFRCTWLGLADRELADFDSSIYWGHGHVSSADRRTTEGEWVETTVAATWPSVVAELCSPILCLFGFTKCSADFVEGISSKFVKL